MTDKERIDAIEQDWRTRFGLSDDAKWLLALARSGAAVRWMSMDTAPKDVSKFLGFWPATMMAEKNETYTTTWWAEGEWQTPYEYSNECDRPTRWLPLSALEQTP